LSFFDELKRRKVFRVAAGYIVAAWALAQVADLVADNFNAPDWVMQMLLTLLVVGLPVALLLSWAFDFTADGITRTGSGGVDDSLVVSNKAVLGFAVGLIVVLPIVFFLMWPRGDRSVAVLPFEDVSPDGNQAYLGIGIADELRLELQYLEGLRVAGRTSSNAYAEEAGKSIGEALNVETILEGSVRKEEDRIRITVQLTNASDGFTIWSQVYDRELERIFEMQEEIATEVAGRLGVSLGVGSINAFHGAGTQNIEAYDIYLQARVDDWLPHHEPIPLLERAVELDPNYAVAWSALANRILGELWDAGPGESEAILERAHSLALRGAELDPESANVQSVLALIQMIRFDFIGSEEGHARAISLVGDRGMIERYALMLVRTGRTAYAQERMSTAMAQEPLGGRPPAFAWHASLAQGRFEEAQERSDWQLGADTIENNLDIAFNKDDPEALKAAIRAIPEANLSNDGPERRDQQLNRSFTHLFEPLIAEFDSPEQVFSILQDVYQDESLQWTRKLHDIAMSAAYFGHHEFALEVKTAEVRNAPLRMSAVWYPAMAEVRQLPEFKEFVSEFNVVEYWRAYGWADYCEPLGDADFRCR
jgi:TolB-like protein